MKKHEEIGLELVKMGYDIKVTYGADLHLACEHPYDEPYIYIFIKDRMSRKTLAIGDGKVPIDELMAFGMREELLKTVMNLYDELPDTGWDGKDAVILLNENGDSLTLGYYIHVVMKFTEDGTTYIAGCEGDPKRSVTGKDLEETCQKYKDLN